MKLLLTGSFKYSEEQLNRIKLLGYEIIFVQDERIPLQIDITDIDSVVCNSLFLYNDITDFKNLKFIQLTSAGMDRVPLDYIKEHGIKIFNAKGVYNIPMAEWAVLKVLEIYKKSRQFYESQHQHKWEKHRDVLELTDKTAAIIGFGNVGTEIAQRLKAFGVNIVGVDRRNIKSDLFHEYYIVDDIDEVLKKSDIVILTIPLIKETRLLIDADKLNKMKDNSVLVNISRGGVIDEVALIEALQRDKFLGIALDVFKEEPLPKNSPLWNFDRVIITPHNSFISDNVNQRLFKLIMENLKAVL